MPSLRYRNREFDYPGDSQNACAVRWKGLREGEEFKHN